MICMVRVDMQHGGGTCPHNGRAIGRGNPTHSNHEACCDVDRTVQFQYDA